MRNTFASFVAFVLFLSIRANIPLASGSRRMDCFCGQKRVTTRIVGGREAVPNSHRWMAGLCQRDLKPFCGGALISDRYILTAAHCLSYVTASSVKVLLGAHDMNKLREAIVYDVDKLISHPNYSIEDTTQNFDIALVRLKQRVNLTESVQPICLPGRRLTSFDNLAVAGWGKLGNNVGTSRKLLEVTLPERSLAECRKLMGRKRITRAHICAGSSEKDACVGDSGGPLTTAYMGRVYQVGIVSWGIRCADPVYPGVYTRVLSYSDWIDSQTQDTKFCNNKRKGL